MLPPNDFDVFSQCSLFLMITDKQRSITTVVIDLCLSVKFLWENSKERVAVLSFLNHIAGQG